MHLVNYTCQFTPWPYHPYLLLQLIYTCTRETGEGARTHCHVIIILDYAHFIARIKYTRMHRIHIICYKLHVSPPIYTILRSIYTYFFKLMKTTNISWTVGQNTATYIAFCIKLSHWRFLDKTMQCSNELCVKTKRDSSVSLGMERVYKFC